MFKNYLLLALRQLRKNRGYSFINIFGLATGMAIALVIGIWTAGEFNVDRSYPDHARIAEILQRQHSAAVIKDHPYDYTGTTISSALRPYLQKGYDDVFEQTAILVGPNESLLVNGDNSISRKGAWADYTFPLIFGYHFLGGSAASMRDPNTALISQSAAIALFGTENAVGKTFKVANTRPFTVGGVFADQPKSSSFHDLDFFASVENPNMNWLTHNTNFNDHSCRMFARLAPTTTMEQATARIKNICTPFVKNSIESYRVYPFEDLYLHLDESKNSVESGRTGLVRLIGIIGVFVLLLACVNFMNLSTARSEQRAKEVGIRKTVGGLRTQLITQFLGESLLIAFLAFTGALLLATLTLPWFSELSGKTMTMPWTSPLFWTLALLFTTVTGLLAGSYPAFYLSGFRPVKVLKGDLTRSRTRPSRWLGRSFSKAGKAASTPRKVLVVAQFSISLALIIGTIVVFRQIQYAKDRPVGYDRTGLITVPVNTDSLDRHYEALRTALLNTGLVANMTSASQTMNDFPQNNPIEWAGQQPDQKNISFRDIWVNADFGPTIGWTVLKGRDFSRDYHTDTAAVIVNESAAQVLGFKDPIGKTIRFWGRTYNIVGETKDMLTRNPYDPMEPALFFGQGGHKELTIRISPTAPMRTALATIEPIFKRFNPASPFIYHFNDEGFERKFAAETRIGNLATVFSGLAILISCLGLFGLASFVAEQRTKEIGVRKVLGARVINLWALLSGDFLKLIALSMAIAMPLIGLAMQKWLENYPIHTSLSPWIFIATGAGMLLVTLATVSFQALKAALINPVKSLRTE